jgi:flagellar hook-associated protein 2
MGSITSGIGLISGIDTATLINNLIALDSAPKVRLQTQVASLQAQQTALLDINARLLNLLSAAQSFRQTQVFKSALATSADEGVLTATASGGAQPGTFKFIVKQLVSTSQKLSKGFLDAGSTPIGLTSLSFELGKGGLAPEVDLESLNGGAGVDRGQLLIAETAPGGASATIDLGDAVTLREVIDRINGNGTVNVTAAVSGDRLVLTHGTGAAFTVSNGVGDTTATDLGIAGADTGGVLTGAIINELGGSTALRALNDSNGVLIRSNIADFRITARDGTIFDVDLGRIDEPITTASLLSDLNNGAGVALNSDDEADISFVDRTGTQHDVDLTGLTTLQGLIDRVSNETSGAITISIDASGERLRIDDTTGGTGLLKVKGAGANGTQAAEDLGLLEETGVSASFILGDVIPYLVDQAQAATVQEVIDRINQATDSLGGANAGRIVAAIGPDGASLRLTDTTGGTGSLTVASTASNPAAARDLGLEGSTTGPILNGRRILSGLTTVLAGNLNGGSGILATGTSTLAGSTPLSALFQGSGLVTNGNAASPDIFVQDRLGATYQIEVDGLDTVQDLIDAFNSATGGEVTLAINGQALEATNNALGGANFQIQDLNGAAVAGALGIIVDYTVPEGNVVTGVDTQPAAATVLDITNRAGAHTVVDLTGVLTLQDVIDRVNAAGAGVTAALHDGGTGIKITDQSGGSGNLILAGNGAASLGVTANVAASTVRGSNLQLRYVSEATPLSALNYGNGVGLGSFRLTDGTGLSALVDIGSDAETLYDVIAEINSRGLELQARINDTGDGILIEGTAADPFVKLKIEAVTGSTAHDLNLVGESETVDGAVIDGSYEIQVEVAASDTLQSIADAINQAGAPVSAAVINTGSGPTPFRLSLTSTISGRQGELFVDTGSFDIGLTTLARGQDAKVFFGADSAEDGFLLTSSSNSISGVVPGLTLDLHDTSEDAVTVTIERDVDAITAAVTQFVTAFNDVIVNIDKYDFYDTETEQRGVLLGNALTGRIRDALHRAIHRRAEGVSTSLQFLAQAGITVGDDGQATFDSAAFKATFASSPIAMENLFAAFQEQSQSSQEIAPGATVPSSTSTVSTRGFGDIFKDLAEGLTDPLNGSLPLADQGFDDRIEVLNSRIEDMDVRLAARRARLERQFAALELALAGLQAQQSALFSLTSNIALAQSAASARRS